MISRLTDEDLIYVFAGKMRISPDEAKNIIGLFVDSFKKCITENETVHIRKMGMFFLKLKKATKLKNFEQRKILLPSFSMVRFRPSESLKDSVNKGLAMKQQSKI